MGSEWRWTTLGAVAAENGRGLVDGPFGSNLPASLYTTTGIPVIRGSNLSLGATRFVPDEFVFVSEHTAKGLARSLCRPFDIIFTKKGTIGQTGLVPVDGPHALYLLSSNQMRLTVDPTVADPTYVYYFVAASHTIQKIRRDSEATGVPKINLFYLREFPILLPPLAEQRRIADILAALDDKIELNRRMSQTLESIARALFKSWFVDFDPVRAKAEGRDSSLRSEISNLFPDTVELSDSGEIPYGWRPVTLGDVSERPQYGFTASATNQPVGPRFLRITDINKLPWIDWSSVPFCEASERERRQYGVKSGDILIARMADPGHGVMIEEDMDAVFASYLIRFRPRDQRYARFLQYWLRSEDYWSFVEGYRTGTTRASLNAQVLSAFPVVLPPSALAEAFGTQISALRSMVARNVSESATLEATRDALVPMLMFGAPPEGMAERLSEPRP